MSMRMEHEMTPEVAIGQLREDVEQIREDLEDLRKFVTGGGDPTKGLLWLAADLARMVASLTTLVDEQRKSLKQYADGLARHERDGHDRRESPWWHRLAYDTARQIAAIAVTVVLLLLLLGTQTWIRTVPR